MKRPRDSKPKNPVAVAEKKPRLEPNTSSAPRQIMSGTRKYRRKKEAAEDARKRGLYIVAYDVTPNYSKAFFTCTGEELFCMTALQQPQCAHLMALPGGWQNSYEGLLWERPCIPFFDLDAGFNTTGAS